MLVYFVSHICLSMIMPDKIFDPRGGCVQTGDWISCYVEGHVSLSACSNCIMQSALYLHLLDQPSHAWHMVVPKKIDVPRLQRDFKLSSKKTSVIDTK